MRTASAMPLHTSHAKARRNAFDVLSRIESVSSCWRVAFSPDVPRRRHVAALGPTRSSAIVVPVQNRHRARLYRPDG